MPLPTLLALAVVASSMQAPPDSQVRRDLYRAQIAAAEGAMRAGELSVARAWLDETEPELRGFEWRVHDAALDESLVAVDSAGSTIATLAASPDGTTIACGCADGSIALRSAVDGSLRAVLRAGDDGRPAHDRAVSCIAFDRSGRRLVSGSHDRTARVWDLDARSLVTTFTGHAFPVGGAAFSPDGRLVASCSYERRPNGVVGTVLLWDPVTGAASGALEGGAKPLVGLAFSPDGSRLAAASWDFCVFVWPTEGGAPVVCAMPDDGIYNAVDAVAWSPDGALVAGASKDRTARVWDAAGGTLVATLRGHADGVASVDFAPDGRTIATASADGSARIWSTGDWTALATLRGHGDAVSDLAYAPNGRRLCTSSSDGTMRLWDADPSRYGGARARASAAPYVVRFSPDDRLLATASYDGRISIFDAERLDPRRSWQAHPEGMSCHALAWTPDGAMLASGSWEPIVRLWDAATGAPLAALEQPEGTTALAISPDGRMIASCSGGRVHLWDIASRTRRLEFTGHGAAVLNVHFSPDSALCVSCGRDGRALVWSTETGDVRHEIAGPAASVADAQFTADGAALVLAGRDGTIVLHDARDGTRIHELARLRHGTDHIAIAPDGARVAVATAGVVLVDPRHGRDMGTLRPHADRAYDVAFDSTGTRLASCSTDGTIAISDTRPLRHR